MVKKKDKKASDKNSRIFMDAAKIATELGKKKKSPSNVKKVVVTKKTTVKKELLKKVKGEAALLKKEDSLNSNKSPSPEKITTTVTVTKTITPNKNSSEKETIHKESSKKAIGHHRTLIGVAKEANEKEELLGFDDLSEEPSPVLNKGFSQGTGLIEMIGGAAMVLIIVEIIVIIAILIWMFFL